MSSFLVVLCTCAFLEKVNGWIFFYFKTGTIKKFKTIWNVIVFGGSLHLCIFRKSERLDIFLFENWDDKKKYFRNNKRKSVPTVKKIQNVNLFTILLRQLKLRHGITKCSTSHVATSQNVQQRQGLEVWTMSRCCSRWW